MQYGLLALVAVAVCHVPLPAQTPHESSVYPFYAMDTNVWNWKERTPEQVATLLKQLGYDGYGHGGTENLPRVHRRMCKGGTAGIQYICWRES